MLWKTNQGNKSCYRPIQANFPFHFFFNFPFCFLFPFLFPFPLLLPFPNSNFCILSHIYRKWRQLFFLKHGQHCEVITRTLVSLCSSSYNWSFHSLLMITLSGRYPDNASCASSDAKGHCFTKSCNAWDML